MRPGLVLFLFFVFFSFRCGAQMHVGDEYQGYKEVNGTKLFYKVIGKGEPILIVHGGPSMNHDYFLPWLQPLAEKYQLIFYDQRASGMSPIPRDSSKDISYRIMVDDIEAMRNAFGIKKLNILSHSWGSKLALNYALQYHEHLGKLIFVSPVTFSHEYDSLQLATIASKTTDADRDERKRMVSSAAFVEGDLELYKEVLLLMYKTSFYDTGNLSKLNLVLPDNFYKANAAMTRGLLADHNRYDKDYYPLLKKLKVPVLIIQGAADNLPMQSAERIRSSVAGSRLVVFNKSGHFPFIEEQQKFNAEVDAFMTPAK